MTETPYNERFSIKCQSTRLTGSILESGVNYRKGNFGPIDKRDYSRFKYTGSK